MLTKLVNTTRREMRVSEIRVKRIRVNQGLGGLSIQIKTKSTTILKDCLLKMNGLYNQQKK